MARSRPHKHAARLAVVTGLAFCAALAAAWLAPRLSEAVATWAGTPAVELRTLRLAEPLPVASAAKARGDDATTAASGTAQGAGAAQQSSPAASSAIAAPRAAVTLDAGTTFTMVGLTCRPPAARGEVDVLLRVSADGSGWSEWYATTLERGVERDGAPEAFTEPVWTGAARYVQVAARAGGKGGAAPLRLRAARLVTINSSEDADREAVVVGMLRRTVATIASIGRVPRAEAMTSMPAIVTRSEWGANESWRSGSPSYAPVEMAFVHHTDGSNSYTRAESAGIVRGIYAYHTKALHWSDIGYNFLIDRYGTIYEGRYGGMTKGVIGAQTLGFNTGSTGVSVMGNFVSASPPAAAVSALERLLAWKLDVSHVDPLGKAVLTCNYGQKFATGQQVTFNAISGHRDANYTTCPGSRLYALLPAIRKVAANTGLPKIYDVAVSQDAISPNADGVQDKLTVSFRTSETTDWRVVVQDDAGNAVRTFSGSGSEAAATWAGKNDAGEALPDGTYKIVVSASSPAGDARAATDLVRIDTVAPDVTSAALTPQSFSPNGDGHSDKATLRYTPAESCRARVSLVSGDAVLRRLTGWRGVGATAKAVVWDGRVGDGSTLVRASEGTHTLLLELRDYAGNETSVRRQVVLDVTLGWPGCTPTTVSPNGDGVRDTVDFGFKLTRTATVTVAVTRAGEVQRTLDLGSLGAGTRSVTWDGRPGDAAAASGAYRCRVTAVSALGTVSVSEPFTVDDYQPRLGATATASVTRGSTAKIRYTPKDPYSAKVKVTVTIADKAGTTVATLGPRWVTQGKTHIAAWTPKSRGTYRLTFRAVDRGGNREAAPAVTVLTVR